MVVEADHPTAEGAARHELEWDPDRDLRKEGDTPPRTTGFTLIRNSSIGPSRAHSRATLALPINNMSAPGCSFSARSVRGSLTTRTYRDAPHGAPSSRLLETASTVDVLSQRLWSISCWSRPVPPGQWASRTPSFRMWCGQRWRCRPAPSKRLRRPTIRRPPHGSNPSRRWVQRRTRRVKRARARPAFSNSS